MEKIQFGIVGAGWRAEFYLRIAHARPDLFAIGGVVVRNPEKAAAFAERWACPVFGNTAEMLAAADPLFVVSSVPWPANPAVVRELVEAGKPVLSETPPAPDLFQMRELYAFVGEKKGRVQVAEQYFLQPHHAARLAVIASGAIGTVSQAQISAAHGYHGMSLIRRTLGIGFESPRVYARQFAAPLVEGPGRDGPPQKETVRDSAQQFLWLDFGGRLGFMDFTGDQYFSWIRGHRVLIRGERGEIQDNTVRLLQDFRTPVELSLVRRMTGLEGNLEGHSLESIQFGSDIVYANPLAPGRLADDEIAIGDCLLRMADYARGGPEVYPLAEACQDHYLGLLCAKALETGAEQQGEAQIWAR